jgi:hypothetical protein
VLLSQIDRREPHLGLHTAYCWHGMSSCHWNVAFIAAYVTGPYALSRLTWAGIPILALVLASHYYCAMLMVRPKLRLRPATAGHTNLYFCVIAVHFCFQQ